MLMSWKYLFKLGAMRKIKNKIIKLFKKMRKARDIISKYK